MPQFVPGSLVQSRLSTSQLPSSQHLCVLEKPPGEGNRAHQQKALHSADPGAGTRPSSHGSSLETSTPQPRTERALPETPPHPPSHYVACLSFKLTKPSFFSPSLQPLLNAHTGDILKGETALSGPKASPSPLGYLTPLGRL